MSASIKQFKIAKATGDEPWTRPNSSIEGVGVSRNKVHKSSGPWSIVQSQRNPQISADKTLGNDSCHDDSPEQLTSPNAENDEKRTGVLLARSSRSLFQSEELSPEPWTQSNSQEKPTYIDQSQDAVTNLKKEEIEDISDKTSPTDLGARIFSSTRILIGTLVSLIVFLVGLPTPGNYFDVRDHVAVTQKNQKLAESQRQSEQRENTLIQIQAKEKSVLLASQKQYIQKIETEAKAKLEAELVMLAAQGEEQVARIRLGFERQYGQQKKEFTQMQTETDAELRNEKERLASARRKHELETAEFAKREAELVQRDKEATERLAALESKMANLQHMTAKNKVLLQQVEKLEREKAITVSQLKEAQSQSNAADEKLKLTGSQLGIADGISKSEAVFQSTQVDRSLVAQVSPNLKPSAEVTDLFLRMEAGKLTHVQRYLKRGGTPNAVNSRGEPLLVKATLLGYYIMVKELLRAGADVDFHDHQGRTALIYAASTGNGGILGLLIAHGADANHTANDGMSALNAASKGNYADIVEVLSNAGSGRIAEGNFDRAGRTLVQY